MLRGGHILHLKLKAVLVFLTHELVATLGVGFGAGTIAFFIFGSPHPLYPEIFNTQHVSRLAVLALLSNPGLAGVLVGLGAEPTFSK
jgi:hypothetical protein